MTDAVTTAALQDWLRRAAVALSENAEYLTQLDSAIGDADHGTNMNRGFTAITAKLDAGSPADIPALFKTVGMTLISSVGGASGPLYGTLFLEMGKNSPADGEMSAADLEKALRAGVAGIVARGHAEVGDKTMVDALDPAIEALSASVASGASAAEAVTAAAEAAKKGSDATEPLVARKGRASYLGERSAGHIDPGSVSATILLRAMSEALTESAG
ncbi:dihydroxyacetone kinase subunit DhaL [Microbacterium sp. ET2]|uniref:dihydroxyacetone kinase subunit DhaL n=1 Tax=Microbacterium albipurpureum TaxID=3050384 RepID=UPI00259C7D3A|nr:dihydroxyacetone kinase subunit DhaL [Microbacterium sp. ET2 (Ac-2212)]WJL94247.1 dihydroxyacetone kinase subunit DhaL [Microbacterium sp. ET2 (Ac-2212)]